MVFAASSTGDGYRSSTERGKLALSRGERLIFSPAAVVGGLSTTDGDLITILIAYPAGASLYMAPLSVCMQCNLTAYVLGLYTDARAATPSSDPWQGISATTSPIYPHSPASI